VRLRISDRSSQKLIQVLRFGCSYVSIADCTIQAGQRWQVERANSWHKGFNRLQRYYERKKLVIDAFFDLADTIIAVRSMIRQS
jgi:hypothetical protein